MSKSVRKQKRLKTIHPPSIGRCMPQDSSPHSAAHSIAANLGAYGREHHATLLTVGLLLAIYDGAEVILKPVFGALVDRVGPRPVLLGGLVGFAVASAAFVFAGDPGLLGVARFGQGAAAGCVLPRGVYAGRPAHADRRPWSTVRQLRRMEGSRVHAGSVGRRSAGHTRRVHTAVLGSVRAGMLRCDVGRLGRTEGRTTASQAVHGH